MNHNNRELFVYRIISSVVNSKIDDKPVKIYPPTTETYLGSCEIYSETMDISYSNVILDEEEMKEWMIEGDLWSWHEDKEMEDIKTKIEDLKLMCYDNRKDIGLNKVRNTLRAVENRYKDLMLKKNGYFQNTCEGISSLRKLDYIIRNSCYCKGELLDLSEVQIDNLIIDYNRFHDIEDSFIRFLSRNEPWRNMWALRKNSDRSLFSNPDREFTNNQKSLLAWSQMYDNVYESYECPSKEVIEDDDVLDGWFIHQNKKRESEKAKSELENSIKSDKIKNAHEVFSVVSNKKEADKIESLNSVHALMIKKQRENTIKSKGGSADQSAFADEKLKLVSESNRQYKGRFGK